MPKRSRAQSETIPVPVMGWNTKDPVSEMDPRYAHEAVNFFSNGGSVDLRNGYRYHAKNIGAGGVYSVFELALQNGSRKLIAVGENGRPYDATSTGGSPTDLSSGGARTFDLGAGSSVNFRNLIFMKDFSTSKDVYSWDGAAAAVALPGFTGPGGDDKALFNPQSYKSRLYFCGNDASVWYGGFDAVSGALTQFDVQSLLRLGGKLLYCGGTSKHGDYDQEYFVMISEQGEVLFYQGDYPGSTTWSIIGHYFLPPPVGYRSFFHWGGDLVIITYQGIMLLSEVLRNDNNLNFISEKINDQFVSALATPAFPLYINGVFYPKGNLLLISILNSTTGATDQYVMNTITGSWWRWTGITAYHWCIWNNKLMFGGNTTRVFQADNGYFDEDPDSEGNALARTIKLRPAYNYFGDRSLTKQFLRARPVVYQSEGLTLTMDADVDFGNVTATSAISDTADTSYKLYTPKLGLKAMGRCASIRIDGTVTTKRMSIQAIDVLWNTGDVD